MTESTEMEEVFYYLGIDWGKSLCGIAVADNETRIANAFDEFRTKEFFDRMEGLEKEFNFGKVIVGRTDEADSQFSPNNVAIDDFIEILKEKGFEVEVEEEFFSTKVAQINLAEVRNRGISKNDNAESARVILQGWLDRRA